MTSFYFCFLALYNRGVFYCVLSLFSVKLKPKGIYFILFLLSPSCFRFTLTENFCLYDDAFDSILFYRFLEQLSVISCLSVLGSCDTNLNCDDKKNMDYCFYHYYYHYYYQHVFICLLIVFHRKVWNVQYRILQSMQAKNCGTLFYFNGNL